MRRRLYVLAFSCLILLTNTQAFAWNNIGHMAVAYVAWQTLKPANRSEVSKLIALNPKFAAWQALIPATVTGEKREMYLFMIAATWADQIKGDAANYPCNGQKNTDDPPAGEAPDLNLGYTDPCLHKYWHYINLPIDASGATHDIPTPNALVKIDAYTVSLKSSEAPELKSYDLVWLEHLVGDIHQPLHSVARYSPTHPGGDAGGNSVKLDSKEGELHAYWDEILGDRTNSLYADAKLAAMVGGSLPTVPAELALDAKTADWVDESATAAKEVSYNYPIGPEWGPYTLDSGYYANATTVAKQRVALAGVRLANVIRTAFPSEHPR